MKKYDKIERFGKDEVEGILKGIVFVQEKIDGANASVYYDSSEGAIIVCSRTRELAKIRENSAEIADEFRGLVPYVVNHSNIQKMVRAYPDQIFYGEWLVKHTILYPDDAYNRLYFYDIDNVPKGEFHHTDDAISIFEKYEVRFIPILKKLLDPTIDEVRELLKVNQFKGSPSQEGVVIKNFGFQNKWGRNTYAKMLNESFQEKKKEVWKDSKRGKDVETQIALTYVTPTRVEKQMHKMFDGCNTIDERRTGELLHRVYHDIIIEEIWDILKKWHDPVIDFRVLKRAIDNEVKRIFFNMLENRVIRE